MKFEATVTSQHCSNQNKCVLTDIKMKLFVHQLAMNKIQAKLFVNTHKTPHKHRQTIEHLKNRSKKNRFLHIYGKKDSRPTQNERNIGWRTISFASNRKRCLLENVRWICMSIHGLPSSRFCIRTFSMCVTKSACYWHSILKWTKDERRKRDRHR